MTSSCRWVVVVLLVVLSVCKVVSGAAPTTDRSDGTDFRVPLTCDGSVCPMKRARAKEGVAPAKPSDITLNGALHPQQPVVTTVNVQHDTSLVLPVVWQSSENASPPKAGEELHPMSEGDLPAVPPAVDNNEGRGGAEVNDVQQLQESSSNDVLLPNVTNVIPANIIQNVVDVDDLANNKKVVQENEPPQGQGTMVLPEKETRPNFVASGPLSEYTRDVNIAAVVKLRRNDDDLGLAGDHGEGNWSAENDFMMSDSKGNNQPSVDASGNHEVGALDLAKIVIDGDESAPIGKSVNDDLLLANADLVQNGQVGDADLTTHEPGGVQGHNPLLVDKLRQNSVTSAAAGLALVGLSAILGVLGAVHCLAKKRHGNSRSLYESSSDVESAGRLNPTLFGTHHED